MAPDSTAISLQAKQGLAPVTLAHRIGDLGWFVSHCVAVATLTALGAVVALAALIALCLAAPAAGLALAVGMHRRDRALRAAA